MLLDVYIRRVCYREYTNTFLFLVLWSNEKVEK